MNLSEFLRLILPSTGIKYLALSKPRPDGSGRNYYTHRPANDAAAMTAAAVGYDRQGEHVFYALAGYAPPIPYEKNGKPRKAYRRQEQALAAKALWLDIDCGADKHAAGTGYPSQAAAVHALVKFCKTTRMPAPLIVDSGSGLHCYWPLQDEITADVWNKFAPLLQAMALHTKLLVDSSRTTDIASVLRPPETTNRKPGRDPATVRVINAAQAFPTKQLLARIALYVRDTPGARELIPQKNAPSAPTPATGAASINADMAVQPDFENGSFWKAAKRCAQIQRWIDEADSLQEPDWRNMLATLKFSQEGEDLAHELSARDPRYTESETQEKLDLYQAGAPPSCDTIDATCGGICSQCPMRGKVPNPMILGMAEREPQREVVMAAPAPAPTPGSDTAPAAAPATPHQQAVAYMPRDFGIDEKKNAIFMVVPDEDGNSTRRYIVNRAFWIEDHVYDRDDNTYYTTWCVRQTSGRIDRFQLEPGEHVSLTIRSRLATMKIGILGNAAEAVRRYMQDSIEEIERKKPEMTVARQLGWDADRTSFALGEYSYANGQKAPVKLGDQAAELAGLMRAPRGTARGWGEAIENLYADPNRAPLLYALCSTIGCVMSPLVPEAQYNGIVLALTSTATGLGKTTAAELGFAAFGDPRRVTMRRFKGDTANFRRQRMGVLNNLPIVFDEWSDIDADGLFELTYEVATGTDRGRLGSDGVAGTQFTWGTSPVLTANHNMSDLLRTVKGSAEANAVRLIEFRLDDLGMEPSDSAMVKAHVRQALDNSGAAGDKILLEVTRDVSGLRQRLALWEDTIAVQFPALAGDAYRFYRAHMACTFEAADMLRRLGIANIDVDALVANAGALIADQAKQTREDYTFKVESVLTDVLRDTETRTHVTLGMPVDGRKPVLAVQQCNDRRGAVARYILGADGTPATAADTMMLSCRFLREWCAANRHDYRRVVDACHQAGLVVDLSPVYGRGKMTLTRNMREVSHSGDSDLLVLDMAKLLDMPQARLGAVADDAGQADYPEAQ